MDAPAMEQHLTACNVLQLKHLADCVLDVCENNFVRWLFLLTHDTIAKNTYTPPCH